MNGPLSMENQNNHTATVRAYREIRTEEERRREGELIFRSSKNPFPTLSRRKVS